MSKERRNALIILAVIAVPTFGLIALDYFQTKITYNQIRADGVDTTAVVDSLVLCHRSGLSRSGSSSSTCDNPGQPSTPRYQAKSMRLTVHYVSNGRTYSEFYSTTLGRKDHDAVYRQAVNGTLLIRYLRKNPAVSLPAAEFTDPKNNPKWGGKFFL